MWPKGYVVIQHVGKWCGLNHAFMGECTLHIRLPMWGGKEFEEITSPCLSVPTTSEEESAHSASPFTVFYRSQVPGMGCYWSVLKGCGWTEAQALALLEQECQRALVQAHWLFHFYGKQKVMISARQPCSCSLEFPHRMSNSCKNSRIHPPRTWGGSAVQRPECWAGIRDLWDPVPTELWDCLGECDVI